MPPTALSGFYQKFLAAHTMPNIGKHPDSIEGFSDGKPVERLRLERTAYERLLVEQEAISDFGRPYLGFDNCETDVNRVHFQNPTSPTANLAAVLFLGGLAIAAFSKRS
jgi:hypothetical protein